MRIRVSIPIRCNQCDQAARLVVEKEIPEELIHESKDPKAEALNVGLTAIHEIINEYFNPDKPHRPSLTFEEQIALMRARKNRDRSSP